jgi:hypothetical protein
MDDGHNANKKNNFAQPEAYKCFACGMRMSASHRTEKMDKKLDEAVFCHWHTFFKFQNTLVQIEGK